MLRRLTTAQRTVLVVALGLLLLAGSAWWYYGEVAPYDSGWFAYEGSQQTDTYWYAIADRRIEFLIVPAVLILLWTAVSIWLLGLRPDDETAND